MAILDLFLHILGYPDTSHILARIWGILLIAVSVGLLLNQQLYRSILLTLHSQYLALLLAGGLGLATGTLSIIFHNVWAADWQGIITLFGWISFSFGACCIVCSNIVIAVAKKAAHATTLVFAALALPIFLLGVYLTYTGLQDTFVEAAQPIPVEISSITNENGGQN